MASTDAFWPPRKNVAYRVVFPIYDADGDVVTAATTPDSEISKDQGTFADCTNEATEIATSSGIYYLDLTSTEMNADCVAIIVKTATAGAKTTVLVLYPQETGDIKVDVTSWLGTAAATPTVAGVPEVDVTHFNGTAGTFAAGRPEVNTSHVGGTLQTAGDIIGDTNDIQTRLPAALVSGRIDASVGAMAAGVVTAAAIATDAIDGDALAATALSEIKTQVTDALNVDTYAEVGQEAPAATQTIRKMLGYLYKAWRNKSTQTATTYSVFADDTTTVDQKATVSDDLTTFTRGEVATGP